MKREKEIKILNSFIDKIEEQVEYHEIYYDDLELDIFYKRENFDKSKIENAKNEIEHEYNNIGIQTIEPKKEPHGYLTVGYTVVDKQDISN